MKTTLEAQGYFVVVPQFPTPAGQSYESWKAAMKNYLDKFDEQTLFIGHGSGGLFAIRLLDELSIKIAGLFLVASYAEPIGHVGYDRVNETFFKQGLDWDKIKKSALVIDVFAGSDDPFVPREATERLAEHLGETVHLIPEGGHLNRASGFVQAIPIAQGIKENFAQLDKTIEVEEVVAPTTQPATAAPAPLSNPDDAVPVPAPVSGKARTMYQDMSLLVNSKKGSVASSLLEHAREEKKVEKARNPLSQQNILYIVGTIIVSAAILTIAGFLFQKYAPASQKPSAPEVPSVLQAERHINIALSPSTQSFQLEKAVSTALASAEKEDGITDIFYTNGTSRPSLAGILAILGITTLPDEFAEQLSSSTPTSPALMHGVTSLEDGTAAHFLVVRIQNYDTTFTLMREWEPTLFRDTAVFMNVPSDVWRGQTTRVTFNDAVIANKNMRVARIGTRTVAYFFLNERTLIITDQPRVVPTLIRRWANSQVYRD
jgi:predicted alpha/beta hydrolase family esterase